MPFYIMAGHTKHVRANGQVTPRSRALRHLDTVAPAYRLGYANTSFQKICGRESKVFLRAQTEV